METGPLDRFMGLGQSLRRPQDIEIHIPHLAHWEHQITGLRWRCLSKTEKQTPCDPCHCMRIAS